MRNFTKPVLSLIVTMLFLVCALASFGPDGSTNTTVAIKDCMEKPTINGQLHIEVLVSALFADSVGFSQGRLFIVHQKVNPDECTFNVLNSITIPFYTDKGGRFTYDGFHWEHNNSEDLIRVELEMNDLEFGYYRDVIVEKYNIPDIEFHVVFSPPL